MADQYNFQNGQGTPQGDGQAQGNYGYTQGQQPDAAYPYQQQAYQQPAYQQPVYQQPDAGYQYQQPMYQQPTPPVNNEHMTTGEWVVTYLLLLIPLANIILPFIWAFSANTKQSKKTWARATLIFMAVGIVISIILIAVLVSVAGNVVNSIGEYKYY